jgi:hypothetical protein
MNLVDLIESKMSDDVMGQLSSLIGADAGRTRSAVGAAVPALLSGLSQMVSSGGGAQKLISALGNFEGGSLGNLTNMLTDKPGALLDQGNSLLHSLMGGNVLTGITDAVSRFTGIGSGSMQKLLGYLMPLVLGGVAGRFAGKPINPQGLASMLAEQKGNIVDAFPSGFSLDSVPGLGAESSAARAAAGEVQHAGSSMLRWLVPVGVLALVAVIVWTAYRPGSSANAPTLAMPNRPVSDAAAPNAALSNSAAPDVSQISSTLTGNFHSVADSLAGVKDPASAAAALPKLKEMGEKLDGMKAMMDRLPDAGKAKIADTIKSSLGSLDDQFARMLWIPGVGDTIKPAVDQVMDKFAALGGLPAPQTSNVSGELAKLVSSTTSALSGIKDTASAEATLPKLKELNDKLDACKGAMAGLPENGRSIINSLVKAAVAKLKEVADRVASTAGVGDKVKPVVDSIIGKLNALTV